MESRPLRADAAASVRRIVSSARDVFAKDEGTLSRIAKEAGVGIATLYRHFPSREDLALVVYEDVFQTELGPTLDQLERSDNPRDSLLILVEKLLGLLDTHKGLALSLPNLAAATQRLMRARASGIEAGIARAQARKTLRHDLTADDIPFLVAMIAVGFGAVPPANHRRYLEFLLDGLSPQHTLELAGQPAARK